MSKYPFVYVLRDDRYKEIDNIFASKKNDLECTVEIISPAEIKKLNNMFDSNHHISFPAWGQWHHLHLLLRNVQSVQYLRCPCFG